MYTFKFGGSYEVVFGGKPLPCMSYESACVLYELLGRCEPKESIAMNGPTSTLRSRELPVSATMPA